MSRMDIVVRNLLCLLRVGVFGQEEEVEPMSAWKWHRMYELAVTHHVAALVLDGIEACRSQFFMHIPDEQWQQWNRALYDTEQACKQQNLCLTALVQQLADNQLRPIVLKGQALAVWYKQPFHRMAGDIDLFFPYETQAKKADRWAFAKGSDLDDSMKGLLGYRWNGAKVEHHRHVERLTNLLLNRQLSSIVERELREQSPCRVVVNSRNVETLPPTLAVLHCLLHISHYLLNDGLALKQLVDLGVYMRSNGQNVDFVKLQDWIETLSLERVAQVAGLLLQDLLHFTPDELPFMDDDTRVSVARLKEELFAHKPLDGDDWYFTQGSSIFVHSSNNSALMWKLGHSVHHYKYYPKESVTNLMASLAHSLSHIEE